MPEDERSATTLALVVATSPLQHYLELVATGLLLDDVYGPPSAIIASNYDTYEGCAAFITSGFPLSPLPVIATPESFGSALLERWVKEYRGKGLVVVLVDGESIRASIRTISEINCTERQRQGNWVDVLEYHTGLHTTEILELTTGDALILAIDESGARVIGHIIDSQLTGR